MERYVIQSAHKTLQVLLVFSHPPHRYTLTEVVDLLEMDKNQVFRAIKTLEYAGFLRTEADGSLSLTPLVNTLAFSNQENIMVSLPRVAASFLQRLYEQAGETVGLYSYNGEQAVLVDLIESVKAIRWSTNVGRHYLLHAGAGSKAILCYLDRKSQQTYLSKISSLPKYTPQTITDLERMYHEIDVTLERGYAVSYGEIDEESHAVAAPIFNSSGKVVGSVTVAGPAYRMSHERIQIFGHMVIDTADEISLELGYIRR